MTFCVLAFAGIARAQQGAITYYVQLVRGTDLDTPPAGACRRIGPRLTATLSPVMKWRSYWEMCLKSVTLEPGKTTRVRLGNGREVEIDLRVPRKRKVTSFADGTVIDRTTSPIGDRMTITGGERDPGSVWFIVVRRDKPSPPKSKI
jgi:hypothetical protein